MSRMARKLSSTRVYHVIFRGINKQDIFEEGSDYERMLDIIFFLKESMGFEIYAYCLMSNHVHIVIKERNMGDISIIFKRVLLRYVMWYNKKYERTGHFLNNRYLSIPVEMDSYFLNLIRYIHQNPVKIGESIEYRWSSYLEYVEKTHRNIVDKEFVWSMISKESFTYFNKEEELIEFETQKKIKYEDRDVREYIINEWQIEPKSLPQMGKKERNAIIGKLKTLYSVRQISRVTGVPRGII